MEEKKVCPECENKEHKLEELTKEEADKVAGGIGLPQLVSCKVCGVCITGSALHCLACGAEQ